jgi:hypothetical protein
MNVKYIVLIIICQWTRIRANVGRRLFFSSDHDFQTVETEHPERKSRLIVF